MGAPLSFANTEQLFLERYLARPKQKELEDRLAQRAEDWEWIQWSLIKLVQPGTGGKAQSKGGKACGYRSV